MNRRDFIEKMKTGLSSITCFARFLKFTALLIPLIACFLYFRYVVPYHICFKEQIQLFVFCWSFVWSYFSKPAALACLGGDFLTQFLYLKWTGAAVVTLLLATEWWLIFQILKRFSIETRRATSLLAVSLLPVAVEWIFYSSVFFYLSYSVSFIIALIAFLSLTGTVSRKGSLPLGEGGGWGLGLGFSFLLIPILYFIAGASVSLFLILVVLYDIHCGRKRFIYWIIISAFTFVIPVLLRHTYLLTLKQAYLFPYQDIKQFSLIALILLVLAAVLVRAFKRKGVRSANKRRIPQWILPLGAWLGVGLILMVGLIKKTDQKQENIYGIAIEAFHENWDKVLDIAERAKLQSTIATNYTNLALSQKNLLGERLMDFYQPFSTGLLLPSAPGSSWFALLIASDAYYHIGDMDMAQHAAMVGMISSPHKRSARLTKRMAEINLAKGDIPAATKYIRILESTLFYRTAISNSIQGRAGIFKDDVIRKSTDVKLSLELLAESDPENIPAINYLLCFYLLNKDISGFFNAYTSYYKGRFHPVPKVYAEALLIYFAGSKSTMREVNEYGIHPDIINKFGEYTRLYESSGGKLPPMQKNFPNTYWLYFHFAVMNKEQ